MAITLIVLFALAVLHFIYEGIILPSLRLNYRFKMFALRDELRSLKAEHPEEINDELFNLLQESINVSIRFLHQIDVKAIIWASREVRTDENLSELVSERLRLLDSCSLSDVRRLMREFYLSYVKCILINNFAALSILLPFLIGAIFVTSVKDVVLRLTKRLITFPEDRIATFVQSDDYQMA